MSNDELPQCVCGKKLDRVDHVGTVHFILDGETYREVSIVDGPTDSNPGLASEVDLRCGYCGATLERPAKAYFYQHWAAIEAAKAMVQQSFRNTIDVQP